MDSNPNQVVNSVSSSVNEGVSMDFNEVIKAYYADFVESTGKGGFTDFRKHVEGIMRDVVKPLCGRSAMSPSSDGNWRDALKSQFKGRGRQWIWVSKESAQPTIDRLAAEGHDTTDYEAWISRQDEAWVRFTGPRIHDGKPVGAFELRLDGSKVDCPKFLHYVPVDQLDEDGLNRMNGTPFSLGLEVDVVVAEADDDEAVSDETVSDEVVDAPIPDQVPMTGLNEFFATDEDEFDEDLFSDC